MKYLSILLFLSTLVSCDRGPKIISAPVESSSPASNQSTGIFSDNISVPTTASLPVATSSMHSVSVLEVLPTEKYVYLRVQENDEEYWIATGKREAVVGQTYLYKDGLLKTNFESKEHNRIFEKVYLVSNLVQDNHGHNHPTLPPNNIETHSVETKSQPSNLAKEGSIKIASLVDNPSMYEGKSVQLSGECTKINPNIMGRNWVHLKDGSKDDYDFVLTTNMLIPEGHFVTLSGIVALNKDFGAGYKYDIIVENAEIVD